MMKKMDKDDDMDKMDEMNEMNDDDVEMMNDGGNAKVKVVPGDDMDDGMDDEMDDGSC